jgi:hypothetical protein
VHLGWQCRKGDPVGRWLLRCYIGNNKYRVQTLGRADAAAQADGADVLSFAQPAAKARAMVPQPSLPRPRGCSLPALAAIGELLHRHETL